MIEKLNEDVETAGADIEALIKTHDRIVSEAPLDLYPYLEQMKEEVRAL